jgi:hypothetical protein
MGQWYRAVAPIANLPEKLVILRPLGEDAAASGGDDDDDDDDQGAMGRRGGGRRIGLARLFDEPAT